MINNKFKIFSNRLGQKLKCVECKRVAVRLHMWLTKTMICFSSFLIGQWLDLAYSRVKFILELIGPVDA